MRQAAPFVAWGRGAFQMERCYVCNHCGRCDEPDFGIELPVLACRDCGHVVEPGESPRTCAACGSERIEERAKPSA